MIRINAHAEGCVLSVRAQAGARREAVVGEHGESLKVAVTAPAQDGRANKALVEFLARALGLKRGQLEVTAGHASREKKFLVRGMTVEELRARIESLI